MKEKIAYLVGIKGVAMTALAVYLKQKGYEVVGSDIRDVFPTDKILKYFQIPIKPGFKAQNINKKTNLVVVTGAHGGMTNVEAQQAIKLNIPTFMHGKYLGKIFSQKEGIAIAGCHGKSTTSALVASLLTHAQFKPSYAVGVAEINDLGAAGHYDKGKYFVAEADEYMTCPMTDSTPRFLYLYPRILLVTNIEYDHPDAYKDISCVKTAFLKLVHNVLPDGLVVACIDNPNVEQIVSRSDRSIITYGFSPRADFKIDNYYFGEGISFFKIKYKKINIGEFTLRIPGKHNILNALGGLIVANQLGINWDKLKDLIKFFTGTKRRFEKIYGDNKYLLYDDYAHHPSEIEATISAARGWFPKHRLIIIFQPHTYSRTKSLLNEFAKSFCLADVVLVTKIYSSAREQYDGTISSQHLVMAANKYKKNAFLCNNQGEVLNFLRDQLQEKSLVITMGAGNIFSYHSKIINLLKKNVRRKSI